MEEYDLPPQTEDDIETLSEATGQSEEQVIGQAIQNFILDQGRQVMNQQAEQRKQMVQEAEAEDQEENAEE